MINVIILAAGNGSRFKNVGFTLPKPLIPVNGTIMLAKATSTLGIDGTYYYALRNNQYLLQTLEAINETTPKFNIKVIDELTEGAAATALLFEEMIDPEQELIIANCDQIMNWDASSVLETMRRYDGCVVTINSSDPKHSFALVVDDRVCLIKEKEVISNIALTGIHYWKHAKYFFKSGKRMIELEDKATNGEYYVAPAYNYLINEGLHIGICMLEDDEFHSVGTPTDLERYENDSRKII